VVQSPLYRPSEYQEHPPEYQEWYRVAQSPLHLPPEYQEWHRVVQSPPHLPPDDDDDDGGDPAGISQDQSDSVGVGRGQPELFGAPWRREWFSVDP
jgi:hypothetical protein